MKHDAYGERDGFGNEYGAGYDYDYDYNHDYASGNGHGYRTPPLSYIPDVPFAPTPPSPPSLNLPPACPPMAYLSRSYDEEMAIRKRLKEQEVQYHKNQVKKNKPILPCYVWIFVVLMAMAAIYFIVYGSIVTVRSKQSLR